MNKGLFSIAFCFMALLCTSQETDAADSKENKFASLKEHFSLTGKCTSIWEEEIRKWKLINGDSYHSINSLRNAITDDNVSLFSSVVRKAWSYQKENGSTETEQNIGRWPISSQEYRVATPLAFVAAPDSIPDDCMAAVWLEPSILNLFSTSEREGKQMNGADVSEPRSSKWAIYWIFVNLESER
ncbi:hypothetical protein [Pseudoalteromonas luteoviolacea]|uniref:Uncharacterized protein n=1 Tax=Pseudoalteromonas luteoviolacea NCIMB 1942 TaxID=1365253 RepID=A0A167HBV6_9GAMM|nr:hypothetical protein [Pseudoalteromonas luteoviolacea]KZN57950.1 hypothetical protein N482_22885 [Pseudoalteromonas luteoviolacea NCIMB 1942]KZX01711.1 hypothetical protein JL49_04100 [Pseudoalteromonas luteoviolacea]